MAAFEYNSTWWIMWISNIKMFIFLFFIFTVVPVRSFTSYKDLYNLINRETTQLEIVQGKGPVVQVYYRLGMNIIVEYV